jgi:hypothetical protein
MGNQAGNGAIRRRRLMGRRAGCDEDDGEQNQDHGPRSECRSTHAEPALGRRPIEPVVAHNENSRKPSWLQRNQIQPREDGDVNDLINP